MADFFIRRPIVAIVASIVITLLGLAVLQKLSIEQYPELSPPTIRVEGTYQGASAEVVEQSGMKATLTWCDLAEPGGANRSSVS